MPRYRPNPAHECEVCCAPYEECDCIHEEVEGMAPETPVVAYLKADPFDMIAAALMGGWRDND